MTDGKYDELDVVALTRDLPEHGLRRGQVGTIVLVHREGADDGAFEVEFVDVEGQTYAMLAVDGHDLMVLHHELPEPARALA